MIYLANECKQLASVRELSAAENKVIWDKQVKALRAAGLAPDKMLTEYTQAEAEALVA